MVLISVGWGQGGAKNIKPILAPPPLWGGAWRNKIVIPIYKSLILRVFKVYFNKYI